MRHGTRFYDCSFSFQNWHSTSERSGSTNTALVELSEDDQGIAAGQYAAFYKGDVCLGSAVISEFKVDQSSAVSSTAREAARVKDAHIPSIRKSKKKMVSHLCSDTVIHQTVDTELPLKGRKQFLSGLQSWMKKCLDWLQSW